MQTHPSEQLRIIMQIDKWWHPIQVECFDIYKRKGMPMANAFLSKVRSSFTKSGTFPKIGECVWLDKRKRQETLCSLFYGVSCCKVTEAAVGKYFLYSYFWQLCDAAIYTKTKIPNNNNGACLYWNRSATFFFAVFWHNWMK